MSRGGCLPFLLLGVALVGGCWKLARGGRLLFVAPVDQAMKVTVDNRPPIIIPAAGADDAFVSWGQHQVTFAVGSAEPHRVTLKADMTHALLVPASPSQCFLLLDVSELYGSSPDTKLPASWRPRIIDRLPSSVGVGPTNIYATQPPKKVRHEPGAPLRVLYPYDCEQDPDDVVAAWVRRFLK